MTQLSIALKGAKNSYKDKPEDIENLEILIDTDTLDVYISRARKVIWITVRGTVAYDKRDLIADIKIPYDQLSKSTRFLKDNNKLLRIFQAYPPSKFKYFITGHSLGGALTSLFLQKYPFIRYGYTFNQASQPSDFKYDRNISRNFIDQDFLYRMNGKFYRKKNVFKYQPRKVDGFFNRVKDLLKPVGIKAHSLENFDSYIK